MDTNVLENRNREYINLLIDKYKIEFTYDQLIYDFKSIYTHTDFDLKRLRLMGVQRMYEIVGDEKVDTNKTKRVQIYVLKKREFEELEEAELQHEIDNLNLIVNLIRETQSILEIEQHEAAFEFNNSFKVFE